MADKKQIIINLDTDSIAKMDKLCERLRMNRGEILRLLFSGDSNNILFVCHTLLSEDGLFGEAHDKLNEADDK